MPELERVRDLSGPPRALGVFADASDLQDGQVQEPLPQPGLPNVARLISSELRSESMSIFPLR